MRQMILAHPQNELETQLLNLFHSLNLPLHFNKTGYKSLSKKLINSKHLNNL